VRRPLPPAHPAIAAAVYRRAGCGDASCSTFRPAVNPRAPADTPAASAFRDWYRVLPRSSSSPVSMGHIDRRPAGNRGHRAAQRSVAAGLLAFPTTSAFAAVSRSRRAITSSQPKRKRPQGCGRLLGASAGADCARVSAYRTGEREDLGQAEDIGDEQDDEDEYQSSDDAAATGRQLVDLAGNQGDFVIGHGANTRQRFVGIDALLGQRLTHIVALQEDADALAILCDLSRADDLFAADHGGIDRRNWQHQRDQAGNQ